MPFVELASGLKLWKGEIPDPEAHYARISGLRMFPSANLKPQAHPAASPADSVSATEPPSQQPAK